MAGGLDVGLKQRLSGAQGLDGVRQAFECFGQAFFEDARALRRYSAEIRWQGRSRQHQYKGNHREANSCDGCRHEHVIGIGDVQAEDIEGNMFERLDVPQDRKCEQGKEHGKRRKNHQGYVETAVEFQSGSAAAAIGEMVFIISTHLGRNS